MSQPQVITIHTDRGQLTLPKGSSLDEAVSALFQQAGQDAQVTSVATAVNGLFVPKHARAQHHLNDGDTVLCFSPITGG